MNLGAGGTTGLRGGRRALANARERSITNPREESNTNVAYETGSADNNSGVEVRFGTDGASVLQLQTEWSPDHSTESFVLRSNRHALRIKRLFDVAIATGSLLVALPVLPVLVALVALTSRGPVIYKQNRVGRGGEVFTILKFRTMRDGTHHRVCNDPSLWAEYVANDYKLPGKHSEVTKVGYVLRKLSLDELPQFWNVLRGDMSIVGVRPLIVDEFEARHHLSRALYVRLPPGITGLWQVEGRSSVQHGERIELDDRYVESWTLRGDLKLLARTPWALLRSVIHRKHTM